MALFISTNDLNALTGLQGRAQNQYIQSGAKHGIVGGVGGELSTTVDITTGNTIQISTGMGIAGGLVWENTNVENIQIVVDGEYYIIANIDLSSTLEGEITLTYQATTVALRQDNLLLNTGGIYQQPLCKITVSGGSMIKSSEITSIVFDNSENVIVGKNAIYRYDSSTDSYRKLADIQYGTTKLSLIADNTSNIYHLDVLNGNLYAKNGNLYTKDVNIDGNVNADGSLNGSGLVISNSSNGLVVDSGSVSQLSRIYPVVWKYDNGKFRVVLTDGEDSVGSNTALFYYDSAGDVKRALRFYSSFTNGVLHTAGDNSRKLEYQATRIASDISLLEEIKKQASFNIQLTENELSREEELDTNTLSKSQRIDKLRLTFNEQIKSIDNIDNKLKMLSEELTEALNIKVEDFVETEEDLENGGE